MFNGTDLKHLAPPKTPSYKNFYGWPDVALKSFTSAETTTIFWKVTSTKVSVISRSPSTTSIKEFNVTSFSTMDMPSTGPFVVICAGWGF